MSKLFKYSLLAVENPETEISTHEINFENESIIELNDEMTFRLHAEDVTFKVTTITKINHINTPNDLVDFRLFAVALK